MYGASCQLGNQGATRLSESACYERSAQERFNERKSEEKQVERLLAVLAKKLGRPGVQGTSSSAPLLRPLLSVR